MVIGTIQKVKAEKGRRIFCFVFQNNSNFKSVQGVRMYYQPVATNTLIRKYNNNNNNRVKAMAISTIQRYT